METSEYFNPGDLVELNKKIDHSPVMLVIGKDRNILKKDVDLKGIRCRWFTTTGELQEAVFNTKDLKRHGSN